MRSRKPQRRYERYPLARSPLAQQPTQRDVAALVGETKSDLNTIAQPRFKEQFLIRRTIQSSVKAKPIVWRLPRVVGQNWRVEIREMKTTGGKQRDLVYPVGRLRGIHERLKFHLNKIVQPSYLMSPRKGRTQRDNASAHSGNAQYLKLDLKQFYPSTTRSMIRISLMRQFGMAQDVAGLIAHLATADDRACFGSPLTPVLISLVHRPMFDAIAMLCDHYGLDYTVWVDDLTISGERVPGSLVSKIREVIAEHGLRSHKLEYRTGNRVVLVTGVGIVGQELVVPLATELKGRFLWEELNDAGSADELEAASNKLLAHLGSVRQVVGPGCKRGQRIANQMNAVRQKRDKAIRLRQEQAWVRSTTTKYLSPAELAVRRGEIEALPF